MYIYLLCNNTRVTVGHGETGQVLSLATDDPYDHMSVYPAFKTSTDAEVFRRGLPFWKQDLTILQLKIAE
jgi:hypothetical protein